MSPVLLDASALLAAILGEPGAERVVADISRAEISAVNAAEVIAKLIDLGFDDEAAVSAFTALLVPVRTFRADTGFLAGRLRAATRRAGLSLGDRACLAEGLISGLTILTADRTWSRLDLPVTIEVIRP